MAADAEGIILQHFDAEGAHPNAECSIRDTASGGRPAAIFSGWFWRVVVVVVFEPVHNSEHVTYRLLAPAQSPAGAAANY